MKTKMNKFVFLIVFTFSIVILASENITDKYGNRLHLSIDKHTKTARNIYGLNLPLKVYGFQMKDISKKTIFKVAEKLISDYKDYLKVNTEDIELKYYQHDEDMIAVLYQQQYKGIPVYSSEFAFTISSAGDIIALGSHVFRDIDVNCTSSITDDQAYQYARFDFNAQSDSIIMKPETCILPVLVDSTFKYFLAKRVQISDKSQGDAAEYFINCENGDIIKKIDMTLSVYTITGQLKGLVCDDPNYTQTENSPLWSKKIKVWDGSSTSYYVTDVNGNYTINNSVYNGGYDLTFYLQNDRNQVADYSNPNNVITSTANNVQPGVYNHDCGATLLLATTPFWSMNHAYDFFRNYIGYSGINSEYFRCIINETIGGSRFSPSTYEIHLNTGIYYGVQFLNNAKSQAILYHEYTHGVVYKIYNHNFIGGGSYPGLVMQEAFSDYFAANITGNPYLFRLDYNHKFLPDSLLRDVENNPSIYCMQEWNNFNNKYARSQILSGALWDFRDNYDSDSVKLKRVNKIILLSLNLYPQPTTFTTYLYNMLIYDKNYYSEYFGEDIIEAFAARGIETPPSKPTLVISNAGTYGVSPILNWSSCIATNDYSVFRDSNYGPCELIATTTSTTFTDTDIFITDQTSAEDKYYYYVSANGDGGYAYSNTVSTWGHPFDSREQINDEFKAIPDKLNLHQNYPNPSNPSSVIQFDMPEASDIQLIIFNTMGQVVRVLEEGHKDAGYHRVIWDGRNDFGDMMPSGVYIYRLKVGEKVFTKRLTLMK